jgi:glycosyltransferase involved in cell wall biosynthesis
MSKKLYPANEQAFSKRRLAKIFYLHHLEATGGGTLRYIEYLAKIQSPQVAFLLFDRKEANISLHSDTSAVRIFSAPHSLPLRIVVIIWQTIVYLAKHRPGIVHAHSSISGFVVRLLQPFFGYRAIYTPHCYSFTYPNGALKNAVYWLIEKALANLGNTTNLHVSMSDYQVGKQLTVRNRGVIIHSPFDWRKQPVDPHRTFESNTIVVIGSNRPQKGYHVLARIADELINSSPPIRILVIGAQSFSSKVSCVPWQENLDEYYSKSFCLLNVSYSEGLSLSLVDALNVGLPIVAFDIPANREILDNGCGVLIEQRNVDDTISAIISLKQNFERYQMLHIRERRRASEYFSPQVFYRKYQCHYMQYGIKDIGIPEILLPNFPNGTRTARMTRVLSGSR